MTPLAARLFRAGDDDIQRRLAAAQFFECTALTPMALEMRRADDAESGFSKSAQLPAPKTLIEIMLRGKRMAFFCQQHPELQHIAVHNISEAGVGGFRVNWRATFKPGSNEFSVEDAYATSKQSEGAAVVGVIFVEKFLCIINQPGLVDYRPRDTDKRILREVKMREYEPASLKWHECHVRPGLHGSESDNGSTHREHQLHYVRKHRKPSLGPDRWIDGYWRGNADLGIHFKDYIVHAPRQN